MPAAPRRAGMAVAMAPLSEAAELALLEALLAALLMLLEMLLETLLAEEAADEVAEEAEPVKLLMREPG
jgi:hypothetical protein